MIFFFGLFNLTLLFFFLSIGARLANQRRWRLIRTVFSRWLLHLVLWLSYTFGEEDGRGLLVVIWSEVNIFLFFVIISKFSAHRCINNTGRKWLLDCGHYLVRLLLIMRVSFIISEFCFHGSINNISWKRLRDCGHYFIWLFLILGFFIDLTLSLRNFVGRLLLLI